MQLVLMKNEVFVFNLRTLATKIKALKLIICYKIFCNVLRTRGCYGWDFFFFWENLIASGIFAHHPSSKHILWSNILTISKTTKDESGNSRGNTRGDRKHVAPLLLFVNYIWFKIFCSSAYTRNIQTIIWC